MIFLLIFSALFCDVNAALFYDSYHGVPISLDTVKRHDKANSTFWCVNEIEPCDPFEGRRVDGSCNNLKYPSRGASHTPFMRILPPEFDEVNYIQWRPYCCTPKGKTDAMCAPNKIPVDDPVHRFSGIRCLNMTRPETFQTVGCIPRGTIPERIITATPLLDLSTIYGNSGKSLHEKGRLYRGGLLKYEVDNGRYWPPSSKTRNNVCFLNQWPHEKRCHAMPEDGGNSLASINLVGIWFWRYHNLIAEQLSLINPCWGDEQLFNTARDINIATAMQMYYYELMPIFLGYDNLVRDEVIAQSYGYRDIYNEDIPPQLSLEYPFVLRWVHTIQEGSLKMYDKNGYYLKQYPIVNLTLRTGFFDVDNNIDYITQGSFRQGSANVDYIADPDITEQGLGPHQKVSDLMTNDLAKNRHFGFQPYVKYRKVCSGVSINSFDDLLDYIDPERVEILKDLYEKVEDVDLMAGIWVERPIYGGFVPPTFYCLVVDQLKRNVITDRHWYERPNRPNAFTPSQLDEIRKANIARFLCDVGDTVTEIQPSAFLRPDYIRNKMVSCNQIAGTDFRAWTDQSCIADNPYIKSKL